MWAQKRGVAGSNIHELLLNPWELGEVAYRRGIS